MRLCWFLYLLTLSSLGFSAIEKDDVLSLPEVQVEDDALNSGGNSEGGTGVTFTAEEIKQQGAISVTDFLSRQGLVQVKPSSSQNQTAISIRGFGNNAASNALILIDNLPLTSFTNIGPNLNSLLLDSIESIDVLAGSYGSRYGSQAVGGVVAIRTQVPVVAVNKTSIAVGNLGQRLGDFFISRSEGPWAFSVGGLGYETSHYQLYNRQNNANLNGKVVYQGDDVQWSANILAMQTDTQLPYALLWDKPVSGAHLDSINHSQLKGVTAYVTHDWWINSDLELNTGVVGQWMDLDGWVNFDFASHQQLWYWQSQLIYQQWLTLGANWQSQEYDLLNPIQNNRVNANVFEGFTLVKVPLTKQLTANFSARYAKQSLVANVTSGQHLSASSPVFVNEQGLSWKPTSSWRWYIRRDTNYRFAKANEKIWVVDNVANLVAQTGVSYEAGVAFERGPKQFSIGVYQLDLNNEIAYDPTPTRDAPFGKMNNLPPTRRLGLDIIAANELNAKWSVLTQLSLVQPKITQGVNQNKQVPGVSPVSASAKVTWLVNDSWTVIFNQAYYSAFYATYDLANQGAKMPRYCLTDLTINKKIDEVTFSFQVNNIFDNHFVRYASFRSGSVPVISYYPDDGANVLLKISASLV